MAYIARDKNKKLYIFEDKPEREDNEWIPHYTDSYISGPCIELPLNTDEKLSRDQLRGLGSSLDGYLFRLINNKG